ncbi:glycosyltransferase family 4 protein [Bordetella pertussis]|uniref:glycosyltransferase family 4 protein n=1 Tax=Bordetella pertussis TaxID=520 RepID=UPI001AD997B7|nr:glycosyltransferase family 4 protein [Bordetella pertussis]
MLSNVPSRQSPDFAQRTPARVALLGPARSIHTIRWANGLALRGLQVHLLSLETPDLSLYDERIVQYRLPWRAPLGYFLAAPRLRALLKRIDPDLLNVHYATGYGLLARRARFSPVLLSAWGSDIYEFPNSSTWHKALLQRNLDHATALAATSHAMQREMRGLTRRPIFVTPFGIDEALFQPAQSVQAPAANGPIVIGTVKALETHYGIDTLIQAFALLRQALAASQPGMAERLVLRIYGAGSQLQRLRAQAQAAHIANQVEFKGRIPHAEVPEALRALDVYVALSRMDSFGVAILEACSCALPVVVSNADGPAEVVVDGKTGYIVAREDAHAAADRLQELVLNPELRQRLGAAGRARVLSEYTWSKSLDMMLDAYTETARLYRATQPASV